MNRLYLFLFVCVLGAVSQQTAVACATCFGDAASPQAEGMNAAIFVLLGVTGSVLTVAATFLAVLLWRLYHHQQDAALLLPDHAGAGSRP